MDARRWRRPGHLELGGGGCPAAGRESSRRRLTRGVKREKKMRWDAGSVTRSPSGFAVTMQHPPSEQHRRAAAVLSLGLLLFSGNTSLSRCATTSSPVRCSVPDDTEELGAAVAGLRVLREARESCRRTGQERAWQRQEEIGEEECGHAVAVYRTREERVKRDRI